MKYPNNEYGGMPEWLIGAVLKTVVPSRVPRVRIPIPPPFKTIKTDGLFCCCKDVLNGADCNFQTVCNFCKARSYQRFWWSELV